MVAFPNLPPLPRLPALLDLDRWVTVLHGSCYSRMLRPNGTFQFDQRPYYVSHQLAGRAVEIIVDGPTRELVVRLDQHEVKRLPLKGLLGTPLPFDEAVAHFMKEARRYEAPRRWRQARMW